MQPSNPYREWAIQEIEQMLIAPEYTGMLDFELRWTKWFIDKSPEQIKAIIEVIADPPEGVSATGPSGWTWSNEEAVCLGAWGRLYPQMWLEQLKTLLNDKKTRRIAIRSTFEVANVDVLPMLETIANYIEEIPTDEAVLLIDAIGCSDEDGSTELLLHLRSRVPDTFTEIHQEIDVNLQNL